ncbi:MAG: DUF3842 family protein [Deltaproteobacteria bacterium]|nr:DUF3842 family protein [Deltaproteobacteria bacterium]
MVVVVMDGQGGGIGALIIRALREGAGLDQMEILALGTNSAATSRMMKSGANRGATGENAVVQTCPLADVIIGPLSIIMPNAMMGEVTPRMAEAVSSSKCKKILIPLIQERVTLVGIKGEPLPHLVDQALEIMKEMARDV